MFSLPLFIWSVNLIVITLLTPTDQTTNGYTNIISNKLIKSWRRPFTRKRFHQVQSTAGQHNSASNGSGSGAGGGRGGSGDGGKPLVPVVYLFRKPKLQDSLSGFSGFPGISSLNGLSGSNGLPNYVTLTDSDFMDDVEDQSLNQNPISKYK